MSENIIKESVSELIKEISKCAKRLKEQGGDTKKADLFLIDLMLSYGDGAAYEKLLEKGQKILSEMKMIPSP